MTGDHISKELRSKLKSIRAVVFDFDGVFTDNMVYVFQDGREAVRCSRFDGLGLRRLEQFGITPLIMSTEENPVVTERSKKLRVRCLQGVRDKKAALIGLANELGLVMDEIAFVGNDINDLSCLRAVGVPIVVCDAHEDVLPYAMYTSKKPGGHGAVREVCDLIANGREERRDTDG